MDCFGTYFTHVRTCVYVRVQSATEWTASVHTLHMSKPNVTRVQSATEWTASVHTIHMSKPNVTRVQSATEWTGMGRDLLSELGDLCRKHNSTVGYWKTAACAPVHKTK